MDNKDLFDLCQLNLLEPKIKQSGDEALLAVLKTKRNKLANNILKEATCPDNSK